jgi:outer membrane protein OmpA-like peptidoglycan-associated protein
VWRLAEKDPDPGKAVPEAGGPEENGEGGSKNTTPGSPWPALWKSAGEKLLTLVISAGSLIGFVAFAGSAVLWSRYFAIHVPPEQAVAAVPQGEAVATGAVMLVLFGFFGALAAVAVYLIDRGGRATPGMSRALLVILTIEAAVAIWIAGGSSVLTKAIASEVLVLVFGAVLWSTFVGGLIELEPEELRDLKKGTRERGKEPEETAFWRPCNRSGVRPLAVFLTVVIATVSSAAAFGVMCLFGASASWAWVVALGVGGAILLLAVAVRLLRFKCQKAEEERSEHEHQEKAKEREKEQAKSLIGRLKAAWKACQPPKCDECDRRLCECRSKREATAAKREADEVPEKPPLFELTSWGAAVVTSLALIAVLVPSLILGEWWLAVSLGAVFVIGSGLWRIAGLKREKFIFLGMAVFISVPLFGAVMLMVRNLAEPQVQAVALIRSSDGPDEAIQGLYVTETSSRVYFANVATEGCSDKIRPAGGRLLWVPRKEVVAMSIGPLESVEDAGKTALEMAYALTPAVETPAGEGVSLTPAEKHSVKIEEAEETRKVKEAEAHAPGLDQRLENPGPAVRPDFGSGLSLYPETAVAGQTVQLRLSVPRPTPDGEGFGPKPDGRTLRLNGVPLDLVREAARYAGEAEYVTTEDGQALSLDKKGVYGLSDDDNDGDEVPYLLQPGDPYFGRRFVKLEDGAVSKVSGGGLKDTKYLEIDRGARNQLLGMPKVTLVKGEKTVGLESEGFQRQAWSSDRIEFEVPENATSGVITVDCGQLAASPLLRVSQGPTARIAVKMQEGSKRVSFVSRSVDEDGEIKAYRWKVGRRRVGKVKTLSMSLPERLAPYQVRLTVTDQNGDPDSVELTLLRLPESLFGFGQEKPLRPGRIDEMREALERVARRRPPAAIEIDGHTDNVGSTAYNVGLSLRRANRVRTLLLTPQAQISSASATPIVPVTTRAFGESCPVDRESGRQPANRRVEIFILGHGASVLAPPGCEAGDETHTNWVGRESTSD